MSLDPFTSQSRLNFSPLNLALTFSPLSLALLFSPFSLACPFAQCMTLGMFALTNLEQVHNMLITMAQIHDVASIQ